MDFKGCIKRGDCCSSANLARQKLEIYWKLRVTLNTLRSYAKGKGRNALICIIISALAWGCNSMEKLEGKWRIISLKDKYYSLNRHPLSNVLSIYLKPNIYGIFPITMADTNTSASELKNITFFKKQSKDFVIIETEGRTSIFNDTFQIVYLSSDSFFIKSRAIDLKCVRVW